MRIVMGQYDHNMIDAETSENSSASTITHRTVNFADLVQEANMEEVD